MKGDTSGIQEIIAGTKTPRQVLEAVDKKAVEYSLILPVLFVTLLSAVPNNIRYTHFTNKANEQNAYFRIEALYR
ncbi:hypothetical protein MHB77_04490 [Paenibacillus sp. FSL K6-3166]|uniref:hypothetical protein n=1 Tax=Paenibacillus sp. FSL K6-3166 TaxID=2921492 RepID=UPI0030F68C9A